MARFAPHPCARTRPAFATVLVLWTIALVAVVLVAQQSAAWRQAAAGREAVARVRAKWAARAGVEAVLARLGHATLEPDATSAYALPDALEGVAFGDLLLASYRVRHTEGAGVAAEERDGPADAHAKLNINRMTRDDLLTLTDMTEDMADSILDWVDADEDTREFGAEAGFYFSLPNPYTPRNAPFRSIAELELVARVRPEFVRGEDWNLSGLLDPNEDDGDLSFPADNADGILDAGWSALLTAASTVGEGGFAASGEPRLDLRTATAGDLAARIGVSAEQAEAILSYATTSDASLEDFIDTDLDDLSGVSNADDLTDDQLALLLDETSLPDAETAALLPIPGKLNINTCPDEVLDYLTALDPALADAILFERESRAGGFTNILDLLEVPSMNRSRLASLAALVDVRSNVFVVTSRGRDAATGLEVEITATLDRSTLPVVIADLIVR